MISNSAKKVYAADGAGGYASDVSVRETAEWFDFSTTTRIECILEAVIEPKLEATSVDVVVRKVPTATLADTVTLEHDMEAATRQSHYSRSDGCSQLMSCTLRGIDWQLTGRSFGDSFTYGGDRSDWRTAVGAYVFAAEETPTITSIAPLEHVIPGSLVTIRGSKLDGGRPLDDRNWCVAVWREGGELTL